MPRYARWAVIASAVLCVMLLLTGCSGTRGSTGTGAALGKAIFTTGRGHAGPVPRSTMGGSYETVGLPCMGCHGAQGQGTKVGPSITRATLGASHSITHMPTAIVPQPQPVTEGPWTPEQTVEVVRTGTTPEGNTLGGRMPRWQLDSQDASALAAYLGSLQ